MPICRVSECIIHKIRHTLLRVRKRGREGISEDLRHIIHQDTKEEFIDAFNAFQTKWKNIYPYVTRSWKNNLDTLTTFFNYPKEIRRYIYTTNTVERFIKEVKRRTKVIEVFPQVNSAEKILYLVSVDMNEKYASRKLRGFQDARDAVIKIREERYGNKKEKKLNKTNKLNKNNEERLLKPHKILNTTDKAGASTL